MANIAMKTGAFKPPVTHAAPVRDTPLRIERDAAGDFVLDAALLADLFSHSVAELRNLTRRGLVSSTVEAGSGDDHGTWRLTLRCGNRMWQAIVNTDGIVQNEETGFTGNAPRSASQRCS